MYDYVTLPSHVKGTKEAISCIWTSGRLGGLNHSETSVGSAKGKIYEHDECYKADFVYENSCKEYMEYECLFHVQYLQKISGTANYEI